MRFGISIHPYSAVMIVCALISLLLSARSWFGTRRALSSSFALLQLTIFVWSVFKLVQLEVIGAEGQLGALKFQYLGIAFIPASYYLIARALINKPAKNAELFLIFFPGFFVLALVWTNDLHHYFWTVGELSHLPDHPDRAWGYWVFLVYAYVFNLAAILMMLWAARRSHGMVKQWIKYFVLLLSLPFATNVVYQFGLFDRIGLDPTPVAFALTGIFMAVYLSRFDVMDAVPYAKNVLIESIDSPLIVIDAEGFVVGANVDAMRISPDGQGLEGRPIVELVPALAGSLAFGDSREWSYRGVDYLITCYSVKQDQKRWRGRILLFRDITALATARRGLEEARAKADAANAAKSAFVATVSHEMRNPLNAIIGLADLDLRAGPADVPKEDLEVILGSGNILLGLVNDLLDLSKIEAGKMELESLDFDLHEKTIGMLKSFRPTVEKKGIVLDIVIEPGTPRFVRGDPLRYGQVLMNLVSNAVKFTEHGAVVVTLSPLKGPYDAEPGDRRGAWVQTSVLDTGMGISAEKMPLLFTEFSQADSSIGRRFGGTGLGLSISKKLVGLFGGEISVQSSPGEGSTFTFTARFEPGEGAKARSAPADEAEQAVKRRLRILVVDDDPINTVVARRYLERFGQEASCAGSGAEALARVNEGEYDLVLLDLGLPDMDGFEACRRIQSETAAGQAGSIPIAAMTARGDSGLRGACASAGMIDCLAKPLDPQALQKLLVRVAAIARGLGPRAAATVKSPTPGFAPVQATPSALVPGAPLLDESGLLERLDGDVPFMRELLGIFIEEAPSRREALAAAIESRDLVELRRLSHGLKGSSLSLCAGPLGAAAGAIEAGCVAALGNDSGEEAAFASLEESLEELLRLQAATLEAVKAALGPA